MTPPQDHPLAGMGWMVASVLAFSFMNLIIKFLGDDYNIWQITFFRCLFALLPLFPFVMLKPEKYRWSPRLWKPYAWRVGLGVLSMICFFTSITMLPMVAAMALHATGPLYTVLFSRLLTNEHATRAQMLALLAGFAGIMAIAVPPLVVPMATLDPKGILLGVLGGVFYGMAMLGLRQLSQTESSSKIVFYFSLAGTLALLPVQPWVWEYPQNGRDLLLLCGGGVLALLGQIALTRAYAVASPAAIAPIKYTDVVWAAFLAFLIWHEVPETNVMVGAGIVVAANLWLTGANRMKKAG
ncbi:MAG: DMT family transporter [Alphaproteobacteria bacterium]|nr:DMT family transporter [Alphaproteobacteria bacterium]